MTTVTILGVACRLIWPGWWSGRQGKLAYHAHHVPSAERPYAVSINDADTHEAHGWGAGATLEEAAALAEWRMVSERQRERFRGRAAA